VLFPRHALVTATGVFLWAFVLAVLLIRSHAKIATSIIEGVARVLVVNNQIYRIAHEKPMKIHRRPFSVWRAHVRNEVDEVILLGLSHAPRVFA
jgi:hypothetical protein